MTVLVESIKDGVPLPDYEFVGDVMTNFDHEAEPWADEKLRSGKYCGGYPANNFYAFVWFDGQKFRALVKQYRVIVGDISAPTLEQIMEMASNEWGWE